MYDIIEIDKGIRKRLTEAIRVSGLTQTEIARQVGVHVSMITDYKKASMPSLITFCVLCKVLDVSADEILGLNK